MDTHTYSQRAECPLPIFPFIYLDGEDDVGELHVPVRNVMLRAERHGAHHLLLRVVMCGLCYVWAIVSSSVLR